MEPLRGMVKVSSPRSLDDANHLAYDLEITMKMLRGGTKLRGLYVKKPFGDKEGPSKAKPSPPPWMDQLEVTTRRKLRDKGKCFYCKTHWELGHHFLGKG